MPDDWNEIRLRGFRGKLHAEVIQGGRPGDLISTTHALTFFSQRVVDVLEEHNFQKYEAFPVEVSGGKGDAPMYYGLTFLGKGGHILPEESRVKYGSTPRPDGSRGIVGMWRLMFDVNQWDGSDLFYVEEFPGLHLVTERVVKALKKAKIKNCEYTPTDRLGF